MLNNFINYLAIGVSSYLTEPEAAADEKSKTVWIIALVAVVLVCIALSRCKFKFNVGENLAAKKAEKKNTKAEKQRNDELERLHEIKRKNQRK